MRTLQAEIEGLEQRLEKGRTVDELVQIRRGLGPGRPRNPAIDLPNLRLGYACKQRWEDMVGDDRVRACAGCERPVFNLSAMTRADAEALLATRGLTPCVRFYRRPDGTVMTSDCPAGEAPAKRTLAAVASSLAVLAAPGVAAADPDPAATVEPADLPPPDGVDGSVAADAPPIIVEQVEMGIIIVADSPRRPRFAWSLWGRLGLGFQHTADATAARRVTPDDAADASATSEAALAADITLGIGRGGDLRLGAWAEVRTSSDPVAGGELVIQGLPPRPWTSDIGGSGSIVVRVGGNADLVTTALGLGYVGSRPGSPAHLIGARVVASVNHSLDDPGAWSALVGIEVEPIGALQAVIDLVTER